MHYVAIMTKKMSLALNRMNYDGMSDTEDDTTIDTDGTDIDEDLMIIESSNDPFYESGYDCFVSSVAIEGRGILGAMYHMRNMW